MRPYKLEACVDSLRKALEAQLRGADRVEVCIRLETEGMTPDDQMIARICSSLSIPVRVMIRETEEGYEADDHELQRMIRRIQSLKSFSIEGFVFGILKGRAIDHEATSKLLQAAYPMPVTFHKAIDLVDHLEDEILWLNSHPQIDTLLSSGGTVHAADGIRQLLRMKSLYRGEIMPAGKITTTILPALHQQLQMEWYHGRAIV